LLDAKAVRFAGRLFLSPEQWLFLKMERASVSILDFWYDQQPISGAFF